MVEMEIVTLQRINGCLCLCTGEGNGLLPWQCTSMGLRAELMHEHWRNNLSLETGIYDSLVKPSRVILHTEISKYFN